MGAAFSWQLFCLTNALAGTPLEGCPVDDRKEAAIAALEEMEFDFDDADDDAGPMPWPLQAWTGRC